MFKHTDENERSVSRKRTNTPPSWRVHIYMYLPTYLHHCRSSRLSSWQDCCLLSLPHNDVENKKYSNADFTLTGKVLNYIFRIFLAHVSDKVHL